MKKLNDFYELLSSSKEYQTRCSRALLIANNIIFPCNGK